MENRTMRPYALSVGEGWIYQHVGIDFTIKAGELGQGRQLAIVECTTRRGEEPPDHTHPTEDEIFCVLQGALTFRCGEETFELENGGFVFLPRGLRHGYTIRSDGEVRLLVVTAPAPENTIRGWGGFVADIEAVSNAAHERAAHGKCGSADHGLFPYRSRSGRDAEPPGN